MDQSSQPDSTQKKADNPEPAKSNVAPEPADNANQPSAADAINAAGEDLSLDARVDTPKTYTPPPAPSKPANVVQKVRSTVSIYVLMMMVVLLVAVMIIVGTYLSSKHGANNTGLNSQTLSQSSLQQLANSDTTVGSSNQVLNVQSSSIFAGKVLMRQDLQVAGNLQVGDTLSLNSITVSGTEQVGQLEVSKNLSVSGDSGLQGNLTISKNLQVNGNGSFSGPVTAPQITTPNLQLTGDLVLTHHVDVGGATPKISFGSALGGGGTASVSGSDTGGSVAINTGSGPAAGCFATLSFATSFTQTPHVLVTPIGVSAGGLSYYVNRSSTSMSICDATVPPANTSFGFDYWAVD